MEVRHRQRYNEIWEEWEVDTQGGNSDAAGADRKIIGRIRSNAQILHVSIADSQVIFQDNAGKETDKGRKRITE